MRNFDEEKRLARRRNVRGLGVIGMAMVLGVAVLSAYALSHKDASVKPASGAAQAMALASSKPASR